MCLIDVQVALGGDPSGAVTQTSGPGGTDPNITGGIIDTNGASAGTYTFDYVVGSGLCQDTGVLTLIVSALPATPSNADYCDDDNTTFNILDLLNSGDGSGATSPAGTWVTTVGGNVQSTFNPQTLGPGTYAIEACLTEDGASNTIGGTGVSSCECCVTWDITVLSAPNAGTDASVAVCNV